MAAAQTKDQKEKIRRTIRIERTPVGAGFRFAWNGGGEVPDRLKGDFTSEKIAKEHFTAWNAEQDEPVELSTIHNPEPSPKAARREIQPI